MIPSITFSFLNTFVNKSTVPDIQSYKTNLRLLLINFEDDDILRPMRSCNIHKAHGRDEMSTRMIKIFDSVMVKPLLLIFKNCLNSNTFPDIWNKSNICPFHNKNDKQIITTDLFHYCLCLIKYLKTSFLNLLMKKNITLRTSIWFSTKWFMHKSAMLDCSVLIYNL